MSEQKKRSKFSFCVCDLHGSVKDHQFENIAEGGIILWGGRYIPNKDDFASIDDVAYFLSRNRHYLQEDRDGKERFADDYLLDAGYFPIMIQDEGTGERKLFRFTFDIEGSCGRGEVIVQPDQAKAVSE